MVGTQAKSQPLQASTPLQSPLYLDLEQFLLAGSSNRLNFSQLLGIFLGLLLLKCLRGQKGLMGKISTKKGALIKYPNVSWIFKSAFCSYVVKYMNLSVAYCTTTHLLLLFPGPGLLLLPRNPFLMFFRGGGGKTSVILLVLVLGGGDKMKEISMKNIGLKVLITNRIIWGEVRKENWIRSFWKWPCNDTKNNDSCNILRASLRFENRLNFSINHRYFTGLFELKWSSKYTAYIELYRKQQFGFPRIGVISSGTLHTCAWGCTNDSGRSLIGSSSTCCVEWGCFREFIGIKGGGGNERKHSIKKKKKKKKKKKGEKKGGGGGGCMKRERKRNLKDMCVRGLRAYRLTSGLLFTALSALFEVCHWETALQLDLRCEHMSWCTGLSG